jgi:hypothetical protein
MKTYFVTFSTNSGRMIAHGKPSAVTVQKAKDYVCQMKNSECISSVMEVYYPIWAEDSAVALWRTYTDDENRGSGGILLSFFLTGILFSFLPVYFFLSFLPGVKVCGHLPVARATFAKCPATPTLASWTTFTTKHRWRLPRRAVPLHTSCPRGFISKRSVVPIGTRTSLASPTRTPVQVISYRSQS